MLCGNSEVEQQVAMLGLDPALGRGELFGELLPELARATPAPTCPTCRRRRAAATLPFRPDRGVANYFGVGGYRRPLTTRGAPACASPPSAWRSRTSATTTAPTRWKASPRDVGADWDFADVRDHYLRELYGVDPPRSARTIPSATSSSSRAVTGEVMAEVFGEWRRAARRARAASCSGCATSRPGAGWGLLDHAGRPKAALGTICAARSRRSRVWTTDEGLNGIAVHVANDRPEPLARHAARRALPRRRACSVEEGPSARSRVAPHGA